MQVASKMMSGLSRFSSAVRCLAIAILTLAMMSILSTANAQTNVEVRAGIHPDYGRLVFDWRRPVGFETSVQGTTGLIRFDTDLRADFTNALRTLGSYINAASVDADNRTVRLSLTTPAQINGFRSGNSLAFDFRQTAAVASPSDVETAGLDEVGVRVGEHPTFRRIVFDWEQRTAYSTTLQNDVLAMQFDRPARVDMAELARRLPDQMGRPQFSVRDGRTLVQIPLPGGSTVRDFRSGEKIAFDVTLGSGPLGTIVAAAEATNPVADTAATPPANPPAETPEAPAAETEIAAAPPEVPETPEPPAAAEPPTPLIQRIDPDEPPPPPVEETAEPETVEEEASIVVSEEEAAEEPAAQGTIAALPTDGGAEQGTEPAPEIADASPTLNLPDIDLPELPGETAEADTTLDVPAEVNAAIEDLAAEEQTAENPTSELSAEVEPEVEPEPEPEQVAQAEDAPLEPEDANADLRIEGDDPNADPVGLRVRTATDTIGPQTEESAATQAAIQDGTIQFKRGTDGREETPEGPAPVSFSFDWPDPVGAAVFSRGDSIWIVFDRRAPLDLAPLRQQGAPLLDRIEQLPITGATVIRMRAQPGVYPIVSLEGFNWVVDFRDQFYPARVQAEIRAEANADTGPRLLFPTANPGNLINVSDPDVGDVIQVATYRDPGVGIVGMRVYPEFRLLETAQGVVMESLGDDVLFERSFDGFALSSTEGLQISSVSPEAPVSTTPSFSARRLFNIEEWARGGVDEYNTNERNLLATITEVPEANKNEARLDLVRFYAAHGRGPEASGVMRVIESNDENIFKDTELRALRGAVRYLNNELDLARQDLSDPRLDAFAEAALWRGAMLGKLGEWRQSASQFQAGDSILRGYPFPLKSSLGLLRIEAALATRDTQSARSWLDELDGSTEVMPRGEYGDLRYYQGQIALLQDDLDLAREFWQEMIDSNDLKNAARSEFALLNMERRQGELEDAEILERLERLRFQWRGDRFELSVLRRLGQIYIDNGDYLQGLSTWRMAVTYFSEDEVSEDIAQDMSDLFRRLYINDEADAMPPLRALSLYDEFRELTPAGSEGDLLIEKLADRLIAVDLLGRAANVLDYQVEFRLEGDEKARIGAKLAYIRLLDNNPNGAIEALGKTAFPQLEEELEDDRRRLRAKANFELDQDSEAIKLLAGDTSYEADILRQDIYRRSENWTEAAKVLQRLSGDPPPLGEEIDEDNARYVVNWAVALKLDRDTQGLDQVRELYGPGMNISSFRDVFNYIVEPNDQSPTDLQASLRQLANNDNFGAFLDNYRDRMLSPVLGPEQRAPVTSGTNNLEG